MSELEKTITRFMRGLKHRNPYEMEFQQAVEELVTSVMPWYLDHERYVHNQILERITEPDRIISFRVTWATDDGRIRANRAWRVQFCNALGPYKGGLRFHPSVDVSVLKFLGFEQTLKNSLTGLPMGGAKGGSNFNPKGKSDGEVMRFCQSLMTEMSRYIGPDKDVPAGDIGVGGREIAFLFGHYLRLQNEWTGALTGKPEINGGSAIRPEATGYGCVYFLQNMLAHHNKALDKMQVVISGSGNVALHTAEQAIAEGATVLTLSDSGGVLHKKSGFSNDELQSIKHFKEVKRGRLAEYAEANDGMDFSKDQSPWAVPCDVALPCATQNELDDDAAKCLVDNGVIAVCEGANMPVTAAAAQRFKQAGVLHAPGKASNAGGVAVSGFEQSQNAMRLSWSRAQVHERLKDIMSEIHDRCVEHAPDDKPVDYVTGANIAGFKRVCEVLDGYGVF